MQRIFFLVITLFISCFNCPCSLAQRPIRVACIGNSVTYGAGIKDREQNSYPAQLQKLLGEAYTVKNFGHSGATLLRNGHNPYHLTDQYAEALSFEPDIAVIHLGLNDTDPRNWPNYQLDFEGDYSQLIDTLRSVNPKIEIHIASLSPIFSGHPRFKSGTREWHYEIRQKIQWLAKANNVQLMDLYQPFVTRPDLFPDNIHPNMAGAKMMADLVHSYLKKDFGGLEMPSIFANGMVLQRGDSTAIFGKGDPDKIVTVKFQEKTKEVFVDQDGKWIVYLEDMPVGGPYELKVQQANQTLHFSEVWIGDVWLCMGQSNMAFPLKSSFSWEEERKQESNKNLHLFQLKPFRETDNRAWDSLALHKVNELTYFEGKWNADRPDFSAVAYHFGKILQEETAVPIGLVQLALGGAPIEAFIDRITLEQDDLLVDMLDNWETSDFIMPWVRERAAVNISNKLDKQQRHPYEPAYIYDAGLQPIMPFGFKGLVWYQGESNAHNADLYARLFRTMVKSYREKWNNSAFPVYYVQLPGMSRPSWPYFRSMQYALSQNVPNTGMAVSLDLGDSLDVHPKAKEEVGRRLALQALVNTYGADLLADGPELNKVVKEGDMLALSFQNDEGLRTKDGRTAVLGFAVMDFRGKRLILEGEIVGNKVLLQVPNNFFVHKVLYGFAPFGPANLVNKAGLPMGTLVYRLCDE
ncbi:lysophospholipase [Echinicola marina]|uniref:GDSL-type esterase/lipase family protein n=1 Tax=Echinicola marina TaxID=2859768 RepID=UPI001CF6E081|nr:GDSL-type esterase/lipase family protein [Echinicola marina]UCS92064.1 lysophospholipase [Echinicola marina]